MVVEDLQDLLSKINGCTFAGMDTTTVVDLRGGRKNNMLGKVTKRVTGSRVMLFTNKKSSGYENMVKRRLAKEGKNPDTFLLGELAWGTRLPDSPIIQHVKNGVVCHYLQVIFLAAGKVEHFLDGEPIAKEDIVGYPPEPAPSARQGLDDEVIVRSYNLNSIDAIRLMGEEVVDNKIDQIIIPAVL